MIGSADSDIRRSAFAWLTERRAEFGEAIPRRILEGFEYRGRRVPLVGPSGIWTPAACALPVSATTIFNGPYRDSFDPNNERIHYAYRRTGPHHRDNQGLRRAMVERVPIIYFDGVGQAAYAAAYPVFVVDDARERQEFVLQVDDATAAGTTQLGVGVTVDDPAPRRAYVTRSFRTRLHQERFRQRVLAAYRTQCALCRLKHDQLLDAAHITPDSEPDGEPTVDNGLALCKLHHAAFDRYFFAVRPDYRVEVRKSVLEETDGPMLVVGLQNIHGSMIQLPYRSIERPNQERLARRFEQFIRAS